MVQAAAARAHTNIALIKYWGKRDDKLILPTSTSLSLTLDSFYTDTRVSPARGEDDQLILNGQVGGLQENSRVHDFINLFRDEARKKDYSGQETALCAAPIRVDSFNHVPTAAGLASSSSAFAALAWALRDYFGLADSMDDRILSTFARQGSGSATRSIFGGLVEWLYGSDSSDSYAYQIDDGNWDLGMIVVALSTEHKKISSRKGMKHTVDTSAFYPLWRQASEKDLAQAEAGIRNHDLDQLGRAMEANVMKFHATMFAADPPITYLTSRSWEVIEYVWDLRERGISCYFTMDAGPNVKILCHKSQATTLAEDLRTAFPEALVWQAAAGSGPSNIEKGEWDKMYGGIIDYNI